MKNIFGKCKIINFTLTSAIQWVKINPFFIQPFTTLMQIDWVRELESYTETKDSFRTNGQQLLLLLSLNITSSTTYRNSSISHRQHHNNLTWHERERVKKLKFNQKMNSHPQNLCFVAIFSYPKRCNTVRTLWENWASNAANHEGEKLKQRSKNVVITCCHVTIVLCVNNSAKSRKQKLNRN